MKKFDSFVSFLVKNCDFSMAMELNAVDRCRSSRMPPSRMMEVVENGGRDPMGLRKVDSRASITEAGDLDLARLPDRPRLKIERKKSFDERSLSEHLAGGSLRQVDSVESIFSLGGLRSALDSPSSSGYYSFAPHPMIAEAWDALRKSIVLFRGQPVGTIAALDHASEEVLNYDQVTDY